MQETYVSWDRLKNYRQEPDRLTEVRKTLEYEQIGLKVDLSEEIWKAMVAQGLNQSDLAKAIGKSRAYVTKVMKGTTNFTFDTVAAILWKLDRKIEINVVPKAAPALKDQVTFPTFFQAESDGQKEYNQRLGSTMAIKEATVGGTYDKNFPAAA